jgi:hypothetical protein
MLTRREKLFWDYAGFPLFTDQLLTSKAHTPTHTKRPQPEQLAVNAAGSRVQSKSVHLHRVATHWVKCEGTLPLPCLLAVNNYCIKPTF